ncbi:MAG TPA: histidine phosphatase family protein [Polyangiales bacterium]|nr:histidine phosphatase family protein [Polyangiales bacterium]
MSIVLVRHGETDGNATRVLQLPDVPLNARGMRQAERLADRLQTLPITQIVCSDLLRARMTAAPIAARLGLQVAYTPLLQERNFGDLRGRSYASVGGNPFALDFVPPNGESWPVFHQRVEQAFAYIAKLRDELAKGELLVVTHGLVCRAMFERHIAWVDAGQPPERFHNTAVNILDPRAPYAARLANCCTHLDPADVEALGGAA